jgi:hypothetical protein
MDNWVTLDRDAMVDDIPNVGRANNVWDFHEIE